MIQHRLNRTRCCRSDPAGNFSTASQYFNTGHQSEEYAEFADITISDIKKRQPQAVFFGKVCFIFKNLC